MIFVGRVILSLARGMYRLTYNISGVHNFTVQIYFQYDQTQYGAYLEIGSDSAAFLTEKQTNKK